MIGFLVLLLASSFASVARAQLYTGSLTGVVTDPTGSVIPGATITLTDVAKGFNYKATTDSTGRYLLRPLPPANYELTVQATGFRTAVRAGIVLDVNQDAAVDVVVQISTTTTAVEVTAAAPLLSTQDAVNGQEVNRGYINDVPLIGRSVFDLAFLSPGVSPAPGQSFGTGLRANNFVSNGERNIQTDILIDGVSTTGAEDGTAGIVPLYTPSVDAVQEFKVEQNNFAADKGFSGGTIVNVVMRSGTNQLHGSAYEFVRNQIWDANNWFNNAASIKTPALRYNDFGGTIGGPIQKNKTFFFGDYEGLRTRTMSTFSAGVPSQAERQGDFGELCAANAGTFDENGMCSNANGQLWDPYSGVYNAAAAGPIRSVYIPFNNMATFQSAGNPKLNGTGYQLAAKPGNLIDPVAMKMMAYFPLPNKGVGTSTYNRYLNWAGAGASMNDGDQFDARIDRQFHHDLLTARYSQGRAPTYGAQCFHNALDPCTQGPNWRNPNAFALNDTYTISPSTVLTLSYGYTHMWTESDGSAGGYPDFSPVTTLGMPSYITRSGFTASPAIDGIGEYATVAGQQNLGTQGWTILRYPQERHDLLGGIDHMRGRHEIKFGAEGRMNRVSFTQPGQPAGTFSFNDYSTSEYPWSGGGDGMASFLTGSSIEGWGQYEVPGTTIMQNFQYAGYFQDNWKTTDKLTLNLGIRYELELPRTERHNRQEWFDPNLASPLQVPGLPNLKGGLVYASPSERYGMNTDTRELAPRIGLAYRVTPHTVLRAGYGIFYNPSSSAPSNPINLAGYNRITNWLSSYQGDDATPWGRLSDPWPGTGPAMPTGNTLGALTDVGATPVGNVRTWNQPSYAQTWSLGFEQELAGDLLVDVNYVGTKGTHLYFGEDPLDNMPPSIEKATPAQLTALRTFVPNPFYGIITDPSSALSAPTVGASQLSLPFPQFAGVDALMQPWGNSVYDAFQLRIQKNLSHGLQFLANYTISKTISDADVGGAGWLGGVASLVDPNNRKLERSVAEYDIPQVLNFSYVWQLPVGHGKRWGATWSPALNAVLGGWQTNGMWRFDNGQPVALTSSGGTPLPTYGQRPNLLGALKRNTGPNWMQQYFANPENVQAPAPDTIGTAPRELPNVRVPGTNTAGLSLFKEIPLGKVREGMRLQYRLESFNAFNHPQFCGPNGTVVATFVGSDPSTYGNFGQVTSQCNSPREVQMALKLYW
jgi:hypothetical protein